MKTIVKILSMGLMLIAGTLTSCTDYQDEIDALDDRVTILENLVNKANSNIDAMQTLVNAMADGWVITGIVEVDADHDPDGKGYRTITFGKIDPTTGELSTKTADKKVITLYNGLNGSDGKDGADAQAPEITLKKDPTDGNYYWVINGGWITGPDGKRIQANGKDGENGKDGVNGKDGKDGENGKDGEDGKDGQNGKDGQDGKDGKSTAPLLGINSLGQWIVSFNNGETWDLLLDTEGKPVKATGNDGKDGKDGANGSDGQNAREFITNVVIKLDIDGNRFVVITLYDGTEVSLPLK